MEIGDEPQTQVLSRTDAMDRRGGGGGRSSAPAADLDGNTKLSVMVSVLGPEKRQSAFTFLL